MTYIVVAPTNHLIRCDIVISLEIKEVLVTSDVWLTVHRNSIWKRNQLDVTLCYPLFLLYKLLNMFRATMCPSSGTDDCVVSSPLVGVVPWLQEGCQNRLAGSVSRMDTLPPNTAQSSAPEDWHMVARNMLSNL